MGTFGDGYRCPTPSANRLENSWEVSLAAAGYLLSTALFTPPPPPTHKPAERSYDLQGFLGTVMGGRWLRGAKHTKGAGIPTSNESTIGPGTAQPRTAGRTTAETPKLLRRLNCAFFSHNDPLAGRAGSSVAPWRVSVRATSSRSGTLRPAGASSPGAKAATRLTLQGQGLRLRTHPTGADTDRDPSADPGDCGDCGLPRGLEETESRSCS